jgi:hypothetical protein
VIQEFKDVCHQWSSGPCSDPDAVWKRLRELRAEAFDKIGRCVGKQVDQVLPRK